MTAVKAMMPMLLCLLAIAIQVAAAASSAPRQQIEPDVPGVPGVPTPPKFADSYELGYIFSMPYMSTLQSKGLRYPVYVWYDGVNQRLREDVYNGLDSTIMTADSLYAIYPRVNKTACDVLESASAGPTLLRGGSVPAPLPDISDWTFGGTAYIQGRLTNVWRYIYKEDDKVNTYTFYTCAKNDAPVRFYMVGTNLMVGSHFDEYHVDFFTYIPDIPTNTRAFETPRICADALARTRSPVRRATQHMSLLPSSHIPRPGAPTLKIELAAPRQDTYLANMKFVHAWNAEHSAKLGFKVGLNKFAFWTEEEYSARMLTRRPAPKRLGAAQYMRVLKDEELPKEVDYRGTGADAEVKDQATCGSCWAFAAVGTMQGTWFKATGEELSLSEQQLVDCAWDYGYNLGCDGGDYGPGIEYIIEVGGSVQEEDYQYMGVDSYCKRGLVPGLMKKHRHPKPAAFFKEYVEVPSRDEQALMEALYLNGPIAVALDASAPSFRFYSEGVYDQPGCMTKAKNLDHAVLLVGYGTSKDGKDYWIIRNSWSKLWGDDGYIKIARDNDCGITTDAGFARVDDSQTARK